MSIVEAKTKKANLILEDVAESLDISPTKHRQAVQRYTSIGDWLCDENGSLAVHRPDVYPQGSFRLGTVVRPMRQGNEGEYDIDLVCRLMTPKVAMEPSALKKLVGDRLKAHATYERLLDPEGRRCWTLEYAEDDGVGFHVDVVPSVEEDSATRMSLVGLGVPHQFASHALAITEKKGSLYSWTWSNPKGYAEWFDGRNIRVLERIRAHQKVLMFGAHQDAYASVEEVPDQDIRTPLQRAIQILKRHRDIRFCGTSIEVERPISILITTLAAMAYQDELDTFAALEGIVNRIENFGMSRIIQKKGSLWVVPNPVNPKENFADRWNDPGSGKTDAFFQWAHWVRQDLDTILEMDSTDDLETVLAPKLGRRVVTEAIVRRDAEKRGAGSKIGTALALGVRGGGLMVAHRQPPRWPMKLQTDVKISATIMRDGWRPHPLESNGPALPKTKSLTFQMHTNLTGHYEVYWQVVNTGTEAERTGNLRGSFSWGSREHTESTMYKGLHWVQCFLVRDGICIARSEEFVINID